jgi:hypothetical protein
MNLKRIKEKTGKSMPPTPEKAMSRGQNSGDISTKFFTLENRLNQCKNSKLKSDTLPPPLKVR